MNIPVTAEHIAEGIRTRPSNPVSLAIRERLNRVVCCNSEWCWLRGVNNEAPFRFEPHVTDWLHHYFNGDAVGPIIVELPDDILATARPGTTLDDRQHI